MSPLVRDSRVTIIAHFLDICASFFLCCIYPYFPRNYKESSKKNPWKHHWRVSEFEFTNSYPIPLVFLYSLPSSIDLPWEEIQPNTIYTSFECWECLGPLGSIECCGIQKIREEKISKFVGSWGLEDLSAIGMLRT